MQQFALASFLESVTGFDLVLIDCPPNLYQCSWNALLASRFVVIPVPPEDFATQGLRAIHQAIEHARLVNTSLQLFGHLVIRADRRLLIHRSYEQHLRRLFGAAVFDTVIPEASSFKVALSCRRPVVVHHPNSQGAKSVRLLADEIMDRIAEADAKRRIA
jgi:chromosome partitioning protein